MFFRTTVSNTCLVRFDVLKTQPLEERLGQHKPREVEVLDLSDTGIHVAVEGALRAGEPAFVRSPDVRDRLPVVFDERLHCRDGCAGSRNARRT